MKGRWPWPFNRPRYRRWGGRLRRTAGQLRRRRVPHRVAARPRARTMVCRPFFAAARERHAVALARWACYPSDCPFDELGTHPPTFARPPGVLRTSGGPAGLRCRVPCRLCQRVSREIACNKLLLESLPTLPVRLWRTLAGRRSPTAFKRSGGRFPSAPPSLMVRPCSFLRRGAPRPAAERDPGRRRRRRGRYPTTLIPSRSQAARKRRWSSPRSRRACLSTAAFGSRTGSHPSGGRLRSASRTGIRSVGCWPARAWRSPPRSSSCC